MYIFNYLTIIKCESTKHWRRSIIYYLKSSSNSSTIKTFSQIIKYSRHLEADQRKLKRYQCEHVSTILRTIKSFPFPLQWTLFGHRQMRRCAHILNTLDASQCVLSFLVVFFSFFFYHTEGWQETYWKWKGIRAYQSTTFILESKVPRNSTFKAEVYGESDNQVFVEHNSTQRDGTTTAWPAPIVCSVVHS